MELAALEPMLPLTVIGMGAGVSTVDRRYVLVLLVAEFAVSGLVTEAAVRNDVDGRCGADAGG